MLANILLVLGIVFLSGGVYLKMRNPIGAADALVPMAAPAGTAAPVAAVVSLPATSNGPTANEVKGTEFEKWIADQFRKDIFKLKQWRGDKRSPNGVSAASDRDPDMLWNMQVAGKSYPFAVECKWRNSFPHGIMDLGSEYQIENYKRYASDEAIPVFIVVGVGGKPSAPQDLYIVPVYRAAQGAISYAGMQAFRQAMKRQSFYFDEVAGNLSY